MHQYIERTTRQVLDEPLFGDRIVRFLYARAREHAPLLFRAATSQRTSSLLGYLNFDMPLAGHLLGNQRFLQRCGVDLDECVEPPAYFTTPRRIFERQIRYWECRPMPEADDAVVAPADARVLVGAIEAAGGVQVKEKFFAFDELLRLGDRGWHHTFSGGAYAVFRLTPDKYHYNHAPVSGKVVDLYAIPGTYHSCNPAAVVEIATPYSKNRRVVTIIDTDTPGGTGVGIVGMVEVVALMIGAVEQRYSEVYYDDPQPVTPGLFVTRGQPKSLYRPGSSTTILLFQPDRIAFAPDLEINMVRGDVHSRFSIGFGQPLAETDLPVRSTLATRSR